MLSDVNMFMFVEGPMEDYYLLVNGLPDKRLEINTMASYIFILMYDCSAVPDLVMCSLSLGTSFSIVSCGK